ncbi:MBL fold metallo-hydrolase [Caldivirga sp. UBA161]|uniref:MBL fold metallo-hydrolase n=1 Tax=Caldivirga sp. UBA161 TaxID=1915569 RepID=UPI0025C46B4E|nr:MBL fold metallo-hydrolase [Caldivirga sp. UBA161]
MVTVEVLGGGGEVGRMAILVKGSRNSILLDYGVNFDDEGKPVFPLHVRPRDLSAVVLSHAHLDHCGALPGLYISASPPLYATPLTAELAEIMFKDTVKLSGYYLPYEDEEVRNTLRRVNPVNFGDTINLNGDSLTFLNAGHVPGSIMTLLNIDGSRILFTGDFNLSQSNLLNGADIYSIPRDIDLVIMEATYAGGTHPLREKLEEEFINAVKTTLDEGGSVLIPSFTIGRTQELLLTLIKHNITDVPIYVDGLARIANRIISKYPQFLRDPNLYAKALAYSNEIMGNYYRKNALKDQAIIITPAGMLKGGAAVYYLKRLGGDRRNALILPSYQAPDSPGYELLTKGVAKIDNEEIKVNAKVYWFDFSAHSGLEELINFINYFKDETNVLIVHSSPRNALKLSEYLEERNIHVALTTGEAIEL